MQKNSTLPIAIRFSNIKKQYRLGMVGGKTLLEDIQSWWARIHGREDPNTPIGVNQRLIGQTFWALNGIDLTIYQGEAVGIIGSNGAGKSTLLKLLSQVTAPTEGDIEIYGRVASLLEIGMGFHGELSGRDNIYMNGAILGMSRKEIDEVMESIIEFSEVGEFIDTPVKRYSSGMYIRLAFAVAVHLRSEILVCDEILAVGDMSYQAKCLDKMREAAEVDGRTVLYVSHNMNTIRRLCQRCIVLDNGKIVFDGDVDQAIAVYMQNSLKSNDVDIDLTRLPHQSKFKDLGVSMQHLLLVDKTVPVYSEGENLKILLTMNTDSSVKSVLFRLTLRNDGDVGLATSWSERISLAEGVNRCELSVPLEKLAKGVFYADLGIYQEQVPGRKCLLDMIQRAFRIEIPGAPNWSTNFYGYFRLPNLLMKLLKGTEGSS